MPNESMAHGAGADWLAQSLMRPLNVTAAVTLAAYDRFVRVTPPGGGTYVVTLPPMAEAVDRGLYFIRCVATPGGTFDVRSQEGAGGVEYDSANLSTDGDFLILVTDGFDWYELAALTD